MNQKLANTDYDAYSYTYAKTRIEGHFGERIIQTVIDGKPNVITFRTNAGAVLQDYLKILEHPMKSILLQLPEVRGSRHQVSTRFIEESDRRIVCWDKNWN